MRRFDGRVHGLSQQPHEVALVLERRTDLVAGAKGRGLEATFGAGNAGGEEDAGG
jgi:hypothetical protein